MTKTFEQLATDLAIDAQASGFDALGDLYDADLHGHLSDAEWSNLCDRAEELRPTVVVPEEVRRNWEEAAWAVYMEGEAERRAFGH